MKIDYKKMLKDLYTSILYILAFIGLVFAVLIYINSQNNSNDNKSDDTNRGTSEELQVSQDPTILETIKSVGAKDYSTLSMSVSSDMLKDCNQDKDSVAGCYSNSTIIARKGYESNKTTAAHEYLHYIWDKHRLDKDHRLESDLIALLTRTPALQTRLQHYYDNNILRLTELFSFACTEIQDSRLTPYIVQKCNEYIDRSTLQMKF